MATHIGEYVLAGELRNSRRNGVFGWIEFAPDYGVRIELTGNLSGDLAGKQVKFTVPHADSSSAFQPGSFPDSVEKLADRQIGVVAEMSLRLVSIPNLPESQFQQLDAPDREKHTVVKQSLYLEWFSQNGQIIAEVVDPIIETIEEDDDNNFDADDSANEAIFTEVQFDVEDELPFNEADQDNADEEDPYGLFDADLGRSVADALGVPDSESASDDPDHHDDSHAEPRRWDEIIPNLDDETKAMYEQWDEIFAGKKDEPVAYLFQTPLKLPTADRVESDEQAKPLVLQILAQLALLSVALDVCEHFTPLQTYRLLMNEILPTARVHPNLAASEMVQHYSTSDYCQQCSDEFEEEADDERLDSDSD
jgi:hypothetical protein